MIVPDSIAGVSGGIATADLQGSNLSTFNHLSQISGGTMNFDTYSLGQPLMGWDPYAPYVS